MMNFSRALALVALLVSAPAVAQDGDGATESEDRFELKYRFTPGEIIRYEVVHQASIETTISGSSQTADTVSKSVKRWMVQDLESDGNAAFEHSVESIDMQHTISGRQSVSYNSQTDETPPAEYEDAARAVGIPLAVVTVDQQGNVLKRLQKHAQHGGDSNSQILYPLPAEAVPVGHVWTVPLDIEVILEGGGTKKIKARQRMELTSVSSDIATIALETQILDVLNNPKIEAQVVQRLSKGTIQFDIEAGRIVGQDLRLDERVLAFSGPGSGMHLKSRFTEKLLAEEPATAQRSVPRTQPPTARRPAVSAAPEPTKKNNARAKSPRSAGKPNPIRSGKSLRR